MKIPEGNNFVMPYLIVDDASAFKQFLIEIFGAKEGMMVMRDDTDVIMHAEVVIGDSTIMMANTTEQFQSSPAGMFIWVENADDTYALALTQGAVSIMAPGDQDYGRSCGVKDPWNNTWWITSPL